MALTNAFRSYGATSYLIKNYNQLCLIVKAGHCAGGYPDGTLLILGPDQTRPMEMTAYDR